MRTSPEERRASLHRSWRHRLFCGYLGAREHRFKTTVAALLRRVLALDRVLMEAASGARYCLDPSDYVQDQILRYGSSEPQSLALVRSQLRPGGVFLDVGGHVGQYAIEAAMVVGEAGRVVVFEPNPKAFLFLKKNVALNALKNVDLVLAAATSHPSTIGMIDPPAGNWGMSRQRTRDGSAEDYRVAGLRIADALCDMGVQFVDMVKMDVEGHELEALEGLFRDRVFRPNDLLVEFVPDVFEYGFALPAYLKRNGYELFTVLGELYTGGARVPEGNLWARRTRGAP
jgi:FkbM family methyltransferase